MHALAAQGLHGLQAPHALAAQGLQALQAAAACIRPACDAATRLVAATPAVMISGMTAVVISSLDLNSLMTSPS